MFIFFILCLGNKKLLRLSCFDKIVSNDMKSAFVPNAVRPYRYYSLIFLFFTYTSTTKSHKGIWTLKYLKITIKYLFTTLSLNLIGCPPEKLVLGLPLYGHTFQLKNAANSGVRAPANGPGLAGPFTATSGTIGYNEVSCF